MAFPEDIHDQERGRFTIILTEKEKEFIMSRMLDYLEANLMGENPDNLALMTDMDCYNFDLDPKECELIQDLIRKLAGV